MKTAITTPPVLAYPRVGWPYRVHTDAAKTGTAYMLTQVQPEEEWKREHPEEQNIPTVRSRERPISYGSAGMTHYQQNYTVTEMEMLAVVRAVKQNEYYLRPPSYFEVVTDHQLLATMMTMNAPSPRLAHWIVYMQEFQYAVKYNPGSNHHVPDHLSRNENQPTPPLSPDIEDPCFTFNEETLDLDLMKRMHESLREDHMESRLMNQRDQMEACLPKAETALLAMKRA